VPVASLLSVTTTTAQAYEPSALGGSLRRFTELRVTLARTDFRLRNLGSALGYLWSLMPPLLFFGVIYVFFPQILQIGKGIPHGRFPRMAIPLSVSLTSVFSVSMNFIAVIVFALVSRITPALSRLEMFPTAGGFAGLHDVRQA
jgi:ABC-2 type transport system permease protein